MRWTHRFGVLVAVATMTLAVAVPPAHAGPAVPVDGLTAPATTRATVQISRSVINLNDRVVVSGRLLRAPCAAGCSLVPVPGARVQLQWWQPDRPRWGTVASVITDAAGRYRFSRAPKTTGAYRVLYPGRTTSPALAPTASVSRRVTVLM